MRLIDQEYAARVKKASSHKFREAINSKGQTVTFLEDPFYGDEAGIIALINDVYIHTGFYDLDDFYPGSDYLPVLTDDGFVVYEYELADANDGEAS